LINSEIITQVNPYQRVPLGAQLSFNTTIPAKASIEVLGEHPIRKTFPSLTTGHEIPVIGLYSGRENTVLLELETEAGDIFRDSLKITAPPLPDFFPEIEITKLNRDKMEPGMHLTDLLIGNNGKFLSYTLAFDDAGEIRWYMDMSEREQITYTDYRLKNGNWFYFDWIDLFEVDDLGKTIKQEQLFNNASNHDMIELDNGNLLMTGSMKDAYVLADGKRHPSRFDAAFIWDRKQQRPIKEWDLRQVLDVDRMVFPPDFIQDYRSDWFHVNSIDRDARDNTLIISGRNQGVVKVDANNQLKWILAPHRAWGKAGPEGKGPETAPFLLTAVDAQGKPLPANVQAGLAGTEDFEWSTGQHAAKVLPNGHLLLFDNGLMRNFQQQPTYSRAVEYAIDEEKGTIRQVWQYGKERGLDMYSAITSEVDVLEKTGNRLITAGNVRQSASPPHGKLIEITYPDNEVVFEARVYFKDAKGNQQRAWAQFDLLFQGERYDLW
jgi:arylsulfate sulfotransferase